MHDRSFIDLLTESFHLKLSSTGRKFDPSDISDLLSNKEFWSIIDLHESN
jgi:hypothetical protein